MKILSILQEHQISQYQLVKQIVGEVPTRVIGKWWKFINGRSGVSAADAVRITTALNSLIHSSYEIDDLFEVKRYKVK